MRLFVLILAAALALGACGRKGDPAAPTAAEADGSAQAQSETVPED